MMGPMGILSDLARSGTPSLDPRVEQIARDKDLTKEQRMDKLSELLPDLKDEHDVLNAQSWLETLSMQLLADKSE